MSIVTEIERIKTNIANAYTACEGKGATMPEILNSKNLSDTINSISGDTSSYKVYGVEIDTTNSNPESAVTYTHDAIGMTAGSSEWDNTDIFKGIKPCMLKNGVVQYYLNPNDFSKKEDGTDADITSGTDGDVMIEVPKLGYKIETIRGKILVKITKKPNDSGFCYYAHTRTTEGDKDKLYISAYLGYYDGTSLRSLSNKKPLQNVNLNASRGYAQNNGSGYDLISFYPLTLLQCLFIIKYKNLDSQSALGQGYVNASALGNTGSTNDKGMYYGTTSTTTHVKFAGIEDMWGNLWWWVDGIRTNTSNELLTAYDNFNDSATGYMNNGSLGSLNTNSVHQYMKTPQGNSEMGFIIKATGGSATTYYPDSTSLMPSSVPIFGGRWVNNTACGIFSLILEKAVTTASEANGARLMYL